MNYDPRAVLDALRAYCAAATGAAPCEHEDTGAAPWSVPFTASTGGYVFTRCGLPAVVTQWKTPSGAVVFDHTSVALFNAAVEFMSFRLAPAERLARRGRERPQCVDQDREYARAAADAAWHNIATLLRCQPLDPNDTPQRPDTHAPTTSQDHAAP